MLTSPLRSPVRSKSSLTLERMRDGLLGLASGREDSNKSSPSVRRSPSTGTLSHVIGDELFSGGSSGSTMVPTVAAASVIPSTLSPNQSGNRDVDSFLSDTWQVPIPPLASPPSVATSGDALIRSEIDAECLRLQLNAATLERDRAQRRLVGMQQQSQQENVERESLVAEFHAGFAVLRQQLSETMHRVVSEMKKLLSAESSRLRQMVSEAFEEVEFSRAMEAGQNFRSSTKADQKANSASEFPQVLAAISELKEIGLASSPHGLPKQLESINNTLNQIVGRLHATSHSNMEADSECHTANLSVVLQELHASRLEGNKSIVKTIQNLFSESQIEIESIFSKQLHDAIHSNGQLAQHFAEIARNSTDMSRHVKNRMETLDALCKQQGETIERFSILHGNAQYAPPTVVDLNPVCDAIQKHNSEMAQYFDMVHNAILQQKPEVNIAPVQDAFQIHDAKMSQWLSQLHDIVLRDQVGAHNGKLEVDLKPECEGILESFRDHRFEILDALCEHKKEVSKWFSQLRDVVGQNKLEVDLKPEYEQINEAFRCHQFEVLQHLSCVKDKVESLVPVHDTIRKQNGEIIELFADTLRKQSGETLDPTSRRNGAESPRRQDVDFDPVNAAIQKHSGEIIECISRLHDACLQKRPDVDCDAMHEAIHNHGGEMIKRFARLDDAIAQRREDVDFFPLCEAMQNLSGRMDQNLTELSKVLSQIGEAIHHLKQELRGTFHQLRTEMNLAPVHEIIQKKQEEFSSLLSLLHDEMQKLGGRIDQSCAVAHETIRRTPHTHLALAGEDVHVLQTEQTPEIVLVVDAMQNLSGRVDRHLTEQRAQKQELSKVLIHIGETLQQLKQEGHNTVQHTPDSNCVPGVADVQVLERQRNGDAFVVCDAVQNLSGRVNQQLKDQNAQKEELSKVLIQIIDAIQQLKQEVRGTIHGRPNTILAPVTEDVAVCQNQHNSDALAVCDAMQNLSGRVDQHLIEQRAQKEELSKVFVYMNEAIQQLKQDFHGTFHQLNSDMNAAPAHATVQNKPEDLTSLLSRLRDEMQTLNGRVDQNLAVIHSTLQSTPLTHLAAVIENVQSLERRQNDVLSVRDAMQNLGGRVDRQLTEVHAHKEELRKVLIQINEAIQHLGQQAPDTALIIPDPLVAPVTADVQIPQRRQLGDVSGVCDAMQNLSGRLDQHLTDQRVQKEDLGNVLVHISGAIKELKQEVEGTFHQLKSQVSSATTHEAAQKKQEELSSMLSQVRDAIRQNITDATISDVVPRCNQIHEDISSQKLEVLQHLGQVKVQLESIAPVRDIMNVHNAEMLKQISGLHEAWQRMQLDMKHHGCQKVDHYADIIEALPAEKAKVSSSRPCADATMQKESTRRSPPVADSTPQSKITLDLREMRDGSAPVDLKQLHSERVQTVAEGTDVDGERSLDNGSDAERASIGSMF